MFHRTVLLALLILALLSGCRSLRDDREAVEYHPGRPATTVVADRDATYRLCAHVPDPGRPTVEVTNGEVVGFRREPDGSLVAIAGTQTTPVPDIYHVWVSSSWPVTRWERFADSTREGCKKATVTVVGVVCLPAAVLLMILTGGAIAQL
jgi:uncharacterized protein YceK